jgi:hypothetical protein
MLSSNTENFYLEFHTLLFNSRNNQSIKMSRGIKCHMCDWPYVPIGGNCPNCGAKDPLAGMSFIAIVKTLALVGFILIIVFFLFLFLIAKYDNH